ncbi:manganese efflux pump MntP family protein [Paenibacillus turpanensis]|uniref:manganese efflux pump MntP n=1 Tax=Paenibacillus turpanensis TaxID=2689078 RepID=UPI00140BC636|nr:manganese efflux pump [Paenibacillus turpanensis]
MHEVSAHLGQMLTIIIIAIALGMDAFSLGLGMGMKGIRKLDVLKISTVIGIFHIIMPLTGMFMGKYVSSLLGDVATLTGGCLLILLGGHMIYSSLRGEEAASFDHSSLWGLLLFALSVSVDSMSVGVSLGLFASDLVFTVLTFGAFGFIMSVMGLMLGRHVAGWAGDYGETFGGVILLVFGIMFFI